LFHERWWRDIPMSSFNRQYAVLVASMMLATSIVFCVADLWVRPARVVDAAEIAGFGVVLVGFATALVGPACLLLRSRIVQPAFPYLRAGFLVLAAPGVPLSLLGALVGVDDFPMAQLVAVCWLYEGALLIGALIFVAAGRRLGFFGPEEWPVPITGRARGLRFMWRHAGFLSLAALTCSICAVAIQAPQHNGAMGRYGYTEPRGATRSMPTWC
jgi:hypothetical protein